MSAPLVRSWRVWWLLLCLSLSVPAGVRAQDDDFGDDEDYDDGVDVEVDEDTSSPFGRRVRSGFGGSGSGEGERRGGAAPWADRLPPDDRPGAPSDGDSDGDDEALDIESGGLPPLDDDLPAEEQPEEAGEEAVDAVDADADAPGPAEGDLPPLMDEPEPERALQLIATAGLGVGSRAFQRPTFRGLQKLPDTPFAAAMVSMRTRIWPRETWSMDVLLVYQSSLGLTLREQPLFALPEDVDVRSSRLELSVAPTLRLGEGEDALRVAAAVGVSMRDFWPVERQYQTPSYTLAGPMLRLELIVPLAGVAHLRVGPEVQWVAWVDDLLIEDGVVGDGIAVAGQMSLSAALSERLSIALDYRESRVYASSVGPMFIDVERFVTAGVSGRY